MTDLFGLGGADAGLGVNVVSEPVDIVFSTKTFFLPDDIPKKFPAKIALQIIGVKHYEHFSQNIRCFFR